MRKNSKFILPLFLSFLLILSNFALVYAENDALDTAVQPQVEEQNEVEEQKQEEISEENNEEINEGIKDEIVEENIEEVVEENKEETVEENKEDESIVEQNNKVSEEKEKITTVKTKKTSINKNTGNKLTTSDSTEIEVATETEFKNIINKINQEASNIIVKLIQDIICSGSGSITLSKGNLTILGENHQLVSHFILKDSAILNLGTDDYTKNLTITSNNSTNCLIDTNGKSTLNIYDGVTLGPNKCGGTAGGIAAHGQSTINMYGGTITDCESTLTVAGGAYLDGNSTFNMYNGTIQNCTGLQGGAIGLSGATPIGGSNESSVTFNMYGGTIKDCVDRYVGGGAVCIFTSYPVGFNMYGGTIENCTNTSYGYGGAVLVYSTDNRTVVNLVDGTITDNNSKYGGGVFVFQGNVNISDGFKLYNNQATVAGDDIYNNGANVILGTAYTGTLKGCNHIIDGWYEDAEARWSYGDCTSEKEHYILFEHEGELYAMEYGLKAAHGEPKVEPEPEPEPEHKPEPTPTPEPKPTPEPEPTPGPTPTPTPEPIPTPEPVQPTQPTQPTSITPTVQRTQTTTVVDENPQLTAEYSETNTIPDPETPMATPEEKYWALLNLILSILTVIFGLIFILYRKDDDLKVEDKRKANIAKIIAAFVAIASVIVFIFTEDMAATMAWIDKWTILMAVILIGEFVIDYYIHKKSQNDEEEEEEEELDG